MTNSSTPRSATSDIDKLVGEAWSQHYRGQNDTALKMFHDLVEKWPDHIDANYGLALTLRAIGQKEQSSQAFRRTKQLVEAAMTSQSEDNTRYLMLTRIIDQHLTRLA